MNQKLSFLVLFTLIPTAAVAQIIPDSSLGTENSLVESNGSRDTIDGGAIRDANLFHSFQEFNVEALREAYFTNPDGIANIFSRVTGNNISDIQGVLGVLGNANLYLINPNGILFGENARLDVNGSFFATTADSVLFENGFEFSAANPDAPPLLTINIPIGLRFRDNPGDIINRSGLFQVPVGETLTFIGGNVRIENGGILFAPGGRVELGSLIETGTIGISEDSSLSFPNGVGRGDVSVDSSFLVVFSGGGGSIRVNANNFNLTNGSGFISGIRNGLGSVNAQSGNIIVNATKSILIDGQGTGILVNVPEKAEGNAGDIELNTGSLIINDGAILDASNLSLGKGGNVIINTTDNVSFANNSTIQVTGAEGGSINISAKNLTLLSDSSFFAGIRIDSGFAGAESGDVIINLTEDLVLDGLDGEGVSVIANSNFGTGNAGSIDIKARNITLKNGGNVSSFNGREGNIGNIDLTATGDIIFDGAKGSQRSGIGNFVIPEATGDIGEIMITAQNLSLTNGAEIESIAAGTGDGGIIDINSINSVSIDRSSISSEAFSTGNSGDIKIVTKNFSVSNGGQIRVSSFGQGNAGNISISTDDTFIATNDSFIISNIGSRQNVPAEGKVGNIFIEAREISFADGAQIQAGFFSGAEGEPGLVSVKAEDAISFTGENTGIFTNTEVGAIGNGSDIKLSAPSFFLGDGAGLAANNAGEGNGGNIEIVTDQFSLTNEAVLTTSSTGQGNAGNILISAKNNFVSANGSSINSNIGSGQKVSAVGKVGNILIKAREVSFTDTAQIQAGLFSGARGEESGEISVKAEDSISFTGERTGIFSNTEAGAVGDASDIQLSASSIFLDDGAVLFADNAGEGDGGNISVNADDLQINQGRISAATASGTGGEIKLQIADNLTLRNNSLISARANNNANGGNIDIDTKFIIAFPNQNNDIIASAAEGQGGNINITTEALFGIEERKATPGNRSNDIDASSEFGLSGEVSITRPDVDPTSGLLELTQEVVDPAKLIAQNVCTQTANSEFVDIGKGGLPQNPDYVLAEDAIEVGLVTPITASSAEIESNQERAEVKSTITRKPPAQGWIFHENGIVELVAYNPDRVGEQRTWDNHRGCN